MPSIFWTGYLEKLAVVALFLAAMYAAARMLQRLRLFNRRGSALNLLESVALSTQATVHVVKAGGRYFLIGSAPTAVNTLAELQASDLTDQTLK
jgi:flagellar biosynthetic protein FliO